MALNLLQIAQEFCKRRGLPQPTTVSGALDDTTLQIWGLLNEGIADISDRFEWQMLRTRYTFIHGNLGAYAALDLSETAVAPGLPDYKAMLNRTLWDTNGRREVNGPLAAKEWEVLLNLVVSQAVYNFTIFGNYLRIYPVPTTPSAITYSMEYISKYGVLTGITPTEQFVEDNSVCRFPTSLILQDLKWRWNYNKGLPYAEDQRTCEEMMTNLQGRDPAPDIQMDNDPYSQVAAPGLLVAAGNWNLP